jgi:beta-lactamase regulating signal transducer with metallopeptidase domain
MQNFLQSVFLQALGYAIANSLWQIALLWLLVVIINHVAKLSSSKKYFVAVTAQFAGFVWFAFTLQYYYSKCAEALSQISAASSLNNGSYIYEPAVKDFSSAVFYYTIKAEQYMPYLSIAYLCILIFLIIRLSRAFYFTQQIRKTGLQKPDVEWRLFIKRTAAYLGIKKEVKIYFSNIIKSPVTIGFLKPLILVPIASINYLTTDQLEALLLHELAHIKRADYLINILHSIIEIILFFNPFVQLLGRVIKKERENSCDDWVLQFQYKPAMYAEALLRIASIPAISNFTMNATGNNSDLLSRVKRMLNKQEKNYNYRNQVFALLLITIMLSTVAWLNPETKYQSASNNIQQLTHKIVVEPLAASADNPLFNPVYYFTKPLQQEMDDAIDIGSNKIKAAEPVIEKTMSQTLARVAPIALEKLQDIQCNVDTVMNTALVKAQKDLNNIHLDLNQLQSPSTISFNFDSTNFASVAKDALLNELNKEVSKKDWTTLLSDFQDAKNEIAEVDKDKTISAAVSNQVTTVLKLTLNQLEQFRKGNLDLMNLRDELKTKQRINERKIEDSKKELDQKIRIQKRLEEKFGPSVKVLKTYSDIPDEDASAYLSGVNDSNTAIASPNPNSIYVPVQFNSNYYYNFNDSSLTSALIVVKHNPANDGSHTKHITVDMIGNNGTHKTVEFTVEVYQ